MIVTKTNGEKIYGVIERIIDGKGDNGESYIISSKLAGQEFISENIEVLEQMIAKFKQEQDK